MPHEGSITLLSQLNTAWPTGSDDKRAGDDHIRTVKTVLAGLLTNIQQLGLDTIEQTLSAASTEITYAGNIQRGSRVTVFLLQDGTGGRNITWDATKFKKATTVIGLAPNTYSIYSFVGHSDGYLWMDQPPRLGVS